MTLHNNFCVAKCVAPMQAETNNDLQSLTEKSLQLA